MNRLNPGVLERVDLDIEKSQLIMKACDIRQATAQPIETLTQKDIKSPLLGQAVSAGVKLTQVPFEI
jgi:hypothetical protein